MAIDPNNLQGTAHVTFNDDFNSLNLWNGTNGVWSTTFWYQSPAGNGGTLASNGEQQWYINSNYGPTSSVKPWTVSDGVLTITAAPARAEISPLINGYGYTSGEINTHESFSQTYGYFEMRAQLPAGQGFWPAFWLVPESGAWPPELDVMEVLGNNTNILYNTIHTAETGYHTAVGDGGVIVPDMSAGYHTYGVDWEADTTTFYFDGQAIYSAATPSDMNQPMYMIANLAAGGYWPGNVVPGTTADYHIDYIRAYAAGTDPSGITTAPVQTAPVQTAPAQTVPAPEVSQPTDVGHVFHSDNAGNHLAGTAEADTFFLGRGGDVVTGGAGADTFVFNETPWAGGHITDFSAGDQLDLSGLVASGGQVSVTADAAGQAQVWSQLNGGSWLVATLDGVKASDVQFDGKVLKLVSGAAEAPAAPAADGQTFTLDNSGNHVAGGTGADTFILGRGGDVVTGGGGADTFVLNETPWAAGHITDFSSDDHLDLSGLLAHAGYAGADPVGAGYLKVDANAAGEAQVWSHLGDAWWLATTLDGVKASDVHLEGAVLSAGSAAQAPAETVPGQTFTSDNAGNHLTGTAGGDTFILGRGGDVVTGGAGDDAFVFNETPWAGGHVTDFSAGDHLDLTGLLAHAGYTGADPVGAGYLKVDANAAGDAQVWSHLDSGWWLVTTLDHVAPSSLHMEGAFITG